MISNLGSWRLMQAGLLIAGTTVACGSKAAGGLGGADDTIGAGRGNDAAAPDDASSGSGGGGGGQGASSGSLGMFNPDSVTDAGLVGPSSVDAACASSVQKGEQQALDAYLMVDYSASMLGPKWAGVTKAINSFVQEPTSGISLGMQYFGQPGAAPLVGSFGDSCDPVVYAKPAIEIAPLPGVGSQITMSLAGHIWPNTGTPTSAALQGAINHASDWAKAHSQDVTIVILATDGDPDECGLLPTVQQVEDIAAAGAAATPKILTFVIGVGTETANLNGIAKAGGTGSAFIVDTTMDVSQQFLAALNKIRGTALGCQYMIPAPMKGSVNFAQVNVQFTSPGGTPEIVPQVSDQQHCPATGNAWYYDDPTSPSQILLCGTACGTVSAGGELDVLTGCQTIIIPTK